MHPCDLGSYQYRPGQDGCKICPDGWYDLRTYDLSNSTLDKSDTCNECEEGYFCIQGYKRPCSLGTYSYLSAHECFPCNGDPEDPMPCIQGDPAVINGKLCAISEYVEEGRALRITLCLKDGLNFKLMHNLCCR